LHYRSYLLRLWRTKTEGQFNWRISLQESKSGHLENFTSLEQLLAYLQNDINNHSTLALAQGKSDASDES